MCIVYGGGRQRVSHRALGSTATQHINAASTATYNMHSKHTTVHAKRAWKLIQQCDNRRVSHQRTTARAHRQSTRAAGVGGAQLYNHIIPSTVLYCCCCLAPGWAYIAQSSIIGIFNVAPTHSKLATHKRNPRLAPVTTWSLCSPRQEGTARTDPDGPALSRAPSSSSRQPRFYCPG